MTGAARARAVVASCFFVSGAAALLYEVVWLRLLGYAFGSTVHATTIVLCTFLGGLALGGIVLGRLADRVARPLRAYGALELAIAAWCAATPLAFRGLEAAYAPVLRALGSAGAAAAAAQLALASVVLLPPTVLMGMTLPLLGRWVAGAGERIGAGVGRLYSLNTWGGVVGALAAGFWLVPAVGLRTTVWIGALLDVASALAAVLVDRARPALVGSGEAAPPAAALAAAPEEPEGAWEARVLILSAFASGAVTMVLEIAWTRALAPVLSSSTYAFSAMLATFLAGLAGGAWAAARAVRRRAASPFAVGLVQAVAGMAALATLPLFALLPEAVVRTLSALGPSFRAALLVQFGGTFALLIVPALVAGATLPLAAAAWVRRPGRIGADVGAMYGANGAGAVTGAIAGGLLLVPAIGAQRAATAAALASVVAGAAVLLVATVPRRRAVLWAAALVQAAGLLALAPAWDRRLMTAGAAVYADVFARAADPGEALRNDALARSVLFFEEGIHATVVVFRDRRDLAFSVNGKVDGSTSAPDMRTQLLLGHLPALLHAAPRRAFVVGLGTGVTARALAAHGLDEVVVAEIEPAVVRAAALFSDVNRGVLDDTHLHVRVGDARHVLAADSGGYDVIASEPSNPWIAGVGNLFTREFYALARSRLAPGGVMVQWLHAYGMTEDDVRTIAGTFRTVFPHTTLWRSSRADLFLVGTEAPVALDPLSLDRRLSAAPEVREDLSRVLGDPGALPWTFVLTDEGVRRFAEGAPLNTDDRPILEFSAPRALLGSDVDRVIRAIRAFRTEEAPLATGARPAILATPAWRLHLARLFVEQGATDDAAEQVERIGDATALPFASRVERVRILQALDRGRETVPELVLLREAGPADEEVARLLSRALAPGPPR